MASICLWNSKWLDIIIINDLMSYYSTIPTRRIATGRRLNSVPFSGKDRVENNCQPQKKRKRIEWLPFVFMVDYLGQQLLLISSFKLISIKTVVLEKEKKSTKFFITEQTPRLLYVSLKANRISLWAVENRPLAVVNSLPFLLTHFSAHWLTFSIDFDCSIDQTAIVVWPAGFRPVSGGGFIPSIGSADFVFGQAQVEPTAVGSLA